MSAGDYRKKVDRVWLFEVKDDRFGDGWYPMSVHLNKAAAEYSVEIFKHQYDDPDSMRVTELRVVKHERDQLKAENAKLREELAKARDPQRIGGQADPSSFIYAIEQLREFRWQHATNDEDAIPYINNVAAAHERENAKLRELVDGLRYCSHEAYGMCARVPVGGERPFTCCPLYDFDAKEYQCEKLMLELGIEVDE